MTSSVLPMTRDASGADWLRGPTFDAILVVGVFALAVGTGGAAALAPRLFPAVLLFDVWVLAFPHVTATYTRIAFDRESARRHWFLLLGLPPLVFAGTLGIAALGGAGALFTAYYVGQTWHYTRQSYGIARAYRRAGVKEPRPSLLTDAVVYAFPVWGLLHRAHQHHEIFYDNPLLLPRVPAFVAHGAGAIACTLFLVWSYQELRHLVGGSKRYGHPLFVLSHVLVTVTSYLVVAEITAGWLIVNIWHNAQYLLFVWMFNEKRFRGVASAESVFLAHLCQPRNAWKYAAFCVAFGAAFYFAVGEVGTRVSLAALPMVLVCHLSVNFHHYLVDGVVWKSRAKTKVTSAAAPSIPS